MPDHLAPSAENLLLGRGAIFFARADGSGGEVHLGNCELLEITPSPELSARNSMMDPTSSTYKQLVKHTSYDVNIKGDEFSKENLALVFLGSTAMLNQSSSSASGETLTVNAGAGRYYKTAFRGISNVVLGAGVAGTTPMTVGTDFRVDARSGRIFVIPGAGIHVGDTLKVSYDYAALSLDIIRAGVAPLIQGFLRYVSDNAAGPQQELQAWSVQLSGDGAVAFITEDFSDFSLKGKILEDMAGHPASPFYSVEFIDGYAAAVPPGGDGATLDGDATTGADSGGIAPILSNGNSTATFTINSPSAQKAGVVVSTTGKTTGKWYAAYQVGFSGSIVIGSFALGWANASLNVHDTSGASGAGNISSVQVITPPFSASQVAGNASDNSAVLLNTTTLVDGDILIVYGDFDARTWGVITSDLVDHPGLQTQLTYTSTVLGMASGALKPFVGFAAEGVLTLTATLLDGAVANAPVGYTNIAG